MKILHIVGSLNASAGGPSRSVPQTCEHLAQQGVHIHLIARPGADAVQVNTSENFRVSFKSLPQLIRFGLQLSKKNVDLIHLQHVWDPYIHVMARIARLKGIPYVVTPRGMLEPWIMQHNQWKKVLGMLLYQRRDLKKATAIHATCKMEKNNIRKLGFTNPISVVPNGITLAKVPQPKLDYGTKKMVFLSRIHEKKGIEILMDAWKKLNNKDWQLEIAGDGESAYVEKLKKSIRTSDLPNLKLVGPQYGTAKWDFLKSADIFVLPTYSENFGIVVAEALAVGVPVITTTGTPWQELETHHCGWWIDLSVENLIKTLAAAMQTDNSQLKKMGQRGRKLITQNYDVNEVAKAIKNVYNKILGFDNLHSDLKK
jgi:glycosyltransferase involved in cell wall biosynthesis